MKSAHVDFAGRGIIAFVCEQQALWHQAHFNVLFAKGRALFMPAVRFQSESCFALAPDWMRVRALPLLAGEKGMCGVGCKNGHDRIDRMAKAHV